MSDVNATDAYLSHNDSAVIKHMEMYQGIITRMANNSAAIKQWGLPVITGILAFIIKDDKSNLVWLSVFALFVFYFLDSYYLMLENRFRNGFMASAELIAEGRFPKSKLFELKPMGDEGRFYLKALTSPATWPVYLGMLGVVITAYMMS